MRNTPCLFNTKSCCEISLGVYIYSYLFPLKTNEITIKKYWQLNVLSKKDSSSTQSKFNKLLKNSVTLRQESSDFPVGILLSGGVDSSAILASMKKEKKKYKPTVLDLKVLIRTRINTLEFFLKNSRQDIRIFLLQKKIF